MSKNLFSKNSLFMVLLGTLFCLGIFSCSKDDGPSFEIPVTLHYAGDVEGWVTIGDITTEISGYNTGDFLIFGRNMNPPNTFPYLSIRFGEKPAKDSTYSLLSFNESVSVKTADEIQYFVSKGNLVVTYDTDSIVASFSNLTGDQYQGTGELTFSGSLTYYNTEITAK
jgi:hypothetical protein